MSTATPNVEVKCLETFAYYPVSNSIYNMCNIEIFGILCIANTMWRFAFLLILLLIQLLLF